MTADVSDTSEFAGAVFELADAVDPADGSTQTYGLEPAGPLADVEKVWLDAVVTAQLDHSTGQISAPAAWDAGFDGSGVTVAVLDTGIDDDHPDLAGQVVSAQNFTWDLDPGDFAGHGTHVASTVAGTGAASDGLHRGVAPGAALLDGKVLGADGSGLLSWIIAGMEWAAGEGADVVNLSLGLPPGHVEAPVLTEALESLSSTHDTLFVAAAGNGSCDRCIGSPADAESALTVGAVDHEDQLAAFSSRGPAHGTYRLKPDLTAPGVQIAAARAGGTGDADGPYIRYSGTSMATPHAAGAVALLKQAHPDLNAQELKGLLVSTATATDGLSAYDQGAGRVNVEHAMSSEVFTVGGPIDFGLQPFPDEDPEPQRTEVTYRNISERSVTLDLDLDADIAVTVEPAQITVPAGGTATAELVLDLNAAEVGLATGRLVATAGDDTRSQTPVGYYLEPEHFDLTLAGLARDGRPAKLWGHVIDSIVIDVETGEPMYRLCPEQPAGQALCIRVPEGTYSAMAFVFTKPGWAESDGNPSTTTPLHTTLVGKPEFTVDSDMDVLLDAREAVEVHVETPSHDAEPILGGAFELAWLRTPAAGPATFEYHRNAPGGQLEERLFMQPTEEVSIGELTATSRWLLAEPEVTLDLPGRDDISLRPRYVRPDYFSDNSWQFPVVDDHMDLVVADAGQGRPEDLVDVDLDGALALIERSDHTSVAEQSNLAADAGARMVAVYNDEPGLSGEVGAYGILRVPTIRLSREEGLILLQQLGSEPVTVRADGTPVSPYVYDLAYAERGGISQSLTYTIDADDNAVTLDQELYAQLEGMSFSATSYPFQPGAPYATSVVRPLLGVPRARVVYHNVDPVVDWQYGVSTPEQRRNNRGPEPPPPFDLVFHSPLTSYGRADHATQSWLRQPLVPGFDPDRPVARYRDILHIPTAGIVDAGGNFAKGFSTFGTNGINALFRVWHGDDILGETTMEPAGTILLPPGEDQFRITYHIDNNAPWTKLSTRTLTEWTFRSSRTADAGEVVPLLTLDYDVDLELTNRLVAPRDRRGPNTVSVTVGHPAGDDVTVSEVTFQVSYDDGVSWQELRTHRQADGSYAVNLGNRAPAKGSGFVSFRVAAEDVHGNGIEQEVIRAAALAAR
nr:S8 family serine peptidase [Phytoactinopolyspora alkaliphila]